MGFEAIAMVVMMTGYMSEVRQTDSSPNITSVGTHVHAHGMAVSQDQLCPASLFKDLRIKRHRADQCHLKNKVHYGDVFLVPGYGYRIVNDCMNKRHKKSIDLWVATKREEAQIKPGKKRIYWVRGKTQ